jgi:hypothetical protein
VVRSTAFRIAFLIAAGCLGAGCSSRSAEQRPLTADAKAYVRNLQLSEVTLKATESYAKQTVTEIEGKITNGGDRVIRHAEVSCVFYDRYGQVVKRERVPIVKAILEPGETRSFRLPFDDLPESWNNQMPQLVIAGIDFS